MLAGTDYQKTLLVNAIYAWADQDPERRAIAGRVYTQRPAEPNVEYAWGLMDKITAAEPKFYHANSDIHVAFEEFVREVLHQNVSAFRDNKYMDSKQHLAYCIWQCVAEHGCFGTAYPELTGERVQEWTSWSIHQLDADNLIDKLKDWGYLQPVPLGPVADRKPVVPSRSFPVPKWTVLYNINSPGSNWVGTGWEFFNDETEAQRCFERHAFAGNVPTKRPFNYMNDYPHLGAVHHVETMELMSAAITDRNLPLLKGQ